MVVDLKSMAEREMEAYDSLPREVKDVFDQCPRKTSVLAVMRLTGVKENLRDMGAEVFARKLAVILHRQADAEAHTPT